MTYSESNETEPSRTARVALWIVIAVVVLALPASCLFLPFITGG